MEKGIAMVRIVAWVGMVGFFVADVVAFLGSGVGGIGLILSLGVWIGAGSWAALHS